MMAGYLNQPEKTAEVMRDGWYVTGDIAMIDEDGFIFITDRLSRFSKIGGEMVPHLKIEEAINVILGDSCTAVTAVPDPTRGERLVAFYCKPDVTPEALWDELGKTDLPKLWLPRRDTWCRSRPFRRSAPARWTCANFDRWPRIAAEPCDVATSGTDLGAS